LKDRDNKFCTLHLVERELLSQEIKRWSEKVRETLAES